MADFAVNTFYGWTALTDIIGVVGILIGFWKIDRSLSGVLIGYVAIKIFQYLTTPILLGFIT